VAVTLRAEAVYAAPPEAVWEVLTDWEGQAAWMPDVAWIRLVGTDREEGARLDVRTRVFGLPAATDRIRVTVWDPPRELAVEHHGVVGGRGSWVLEAVPPGTRLQWTEELQLPGGSGGDLAMRAYAPWQTAMLRRSLRNLGHLVER
jgi:uncharacterized protein YndB with AHSA1/START domain